MAIEKGVMGVRKRGAMGCEDVWEEAGLSDDDGVQRLLSRFREGGGELVVVPIVSRALSVPSVRIVAVHFSSSRRVVSRWESSAGRPTFRSERAGSCRLTVPARAERDRSVWLLSR